MGRRPPAVMMSRLVEPEILETLPDHDPAAIHSRRDLRIVNAVMGNHRWMLRTLRRHYQPGWRITELGAGDGALSLRLCQAGLCRPRDLHAFDLVAKPSPWPADAGWTQGDLFEHELPPSEVVIVNLLLHHFQDHQLRVLGQRLPAATRLFLAAEPARSPLHAVLGRLLCVAAGFHAVTRYDMQVSIRAGFRGTELPRALELTPPWKVRMSPSPFGACRMLAHR
jgi:hypothetical protein